MTIRPATTADAAAIWRIFQAVVAPGDTYSFTRETTEREAVAYFLGPGITSFGIRLPKTLRRGKPRPKVFADGGLVDGRARGRLVTGRFAGEARSAKVVWRGLRPGRRLRRSATVRLTLTDARGHVTRLKQRVPVLGKRPKRR